jgi:mannan endo-1,4-beta-mannosidase
MKHIFAPEPLLMRTRLLLSLAAVLALATLAHADSPFTHFITRAGDQLFDGPNPYRFISFNIPNLHYVEDNVPFGQTNPWRLPDQFEIVDSLESIRQAGGLVVRTYTLSVRRPGDPDDIPVHVLAPGKFDEDAFRALDVVLAEANRLGVRLIIPLVDEHIWWGGRGEYASMRGKTKNDFWTDPQLLADFETTILYVVNRKNTCTGVRYRDDKAILAWETGNELQCPPEWTRRIAAYIKSVDPNHLVVDGRNASRLSKASVDDANVDLVTTHHYSTNAQETLAEIRANRALSKGKKPYFVGEFGFLDTAAFEQILDTVIDTGTAGALLWSLRCHDRDGGFYWHSEPMVAGRYKAYHWPGFASGDGYDETGVLGLMRRKAFAIRRVAAPPIEPPARPQLLPIPNAASITWRGSTGASGYDLDRAATPNGPWTTIGRDLSDADVAHRPLFHDATARVGQTCYYRLRAKNSAGASDYSNVVGPVKIDCLWLIDALRDGAELHARHGRLEFVSKYARQAQEDSNRLAGTAGASIEYHTAGPITAATIYAFFPGQVSDLCFAVSPDGARYTPVPAPGRSHFSGKGMYGYFNPVDYRLEDLPKDTRYLKIEYTTETELSRVEIQYAPLASSNTKARKDENAKEERDEGLRRNKECYFRGTYILVCPTKARQECAPL